MKKKNLYKLAILGIFVSFSFSACNGDDEENNAPIGANVFTGKRLSKIIKDEKRGWFFQFVYDENKRLIKFTEYYKGYINDGYQYLLAYEGKKVTISAYRGTQKTTFLLNNTNYAISCNGSHNLTFEYNAEGHLIGYGNWKLECKNGNVIRASMKDSSYNGSSPISYTYDEHLNINGIIPFENYWLTLYDGIKDEGAQSYSQTRWDYDDYDLLFVAYYAGILGKPTKNVAKSASPKSSYEIQPSYDEEGNVTKYEGSIYEYE